MAVKVKIVNDNKDKRWSKDDEIALLRGVVDAVSAASTSSPDGSLYLDEFFNGGTGPGGATLADWVERRILNDEYPRLYAEYVSMQTQLSDRTNAEQKAGAVYLNDLTAKDREIEHIRATADKAVRASGERIKALEAANALLQRSLYEHEAEHHAAKRALSAVKRYVMAAWASKTAIDHNIMRDCFVTHEEIARQSRNARRADWDAAARDQIEHDEAEFQAGLDDYYDDRADEYDYVADDLAYDAAHAGGR